jgi:carbon storage regulator
MLVLSRKVGEEIQIGSDIRIRIVKLSAGQVCVGIDAPHHMPVLRSELLKDRRGDNRRAAG